MVRNLRSEAREIATGLLGKDVVIRLKEVKGTTFPAWKIYVKVPGMKRGRHIATLFIR